MLIWRTLFNPGCFFICYTMTRQRKLKPTDSSPSQLERRPKSLRQRNKNSGPNLLRILCVLGFLTLVFASYAVWNYRRVARLYTPLDVSPVIDSTKSDMRRFWGSYRSNLYFGMRTRSPKSLMTGLMWFSMYSPDGQVKIRHTCEQSDGLEKYGWKQHDGVNFGSQEINEEEFVITTEFLKKFGGKHGGDWTARISGKEMGNHAGLVSIMYYATHEGESEMVPVVQKNMLTSIRGQSPELGKFALRFPQPPRVKSSSFLVTHTPNVHSVKDVVMNNLRYVKTGKDKRLLALAGHVTKRDANQRELPMNLFVQQWSLELPFDVEVIFESDSFTSRTEQLSGDVFIQALQHYRVQFEKKFENKFPLKASGYTQKQVSFAQAALSNMIGGIGYFYGKSRVISALVKAPTDYWEGALYTAVPSRPFFPRGFLWDEGFHQLLISQWDSSISKDIIGHWLDLMNSEGWIPREQILGDEARTKVPAEFVVQHNENANPPTLILPIKSMIDKGALERDYLKRIFPRLKTWFNWFNTTQLGNLPSTYRWHGRNAKSDRELNPKTLTSGLDDYPRASHPSDDERHVDLRCWLAFASGLMADIAKAVGEKSDELLYRATNRYLSDNELLDKYHWSKAQIYSDYGNHTKLVKLAFRSTHPGGPKKKVRVVTSKTGPTLKHVNAFGYISLFPFLLHILDPLSPNLEKVLKDLHNADLLWTPYGLRSLSKADPMYLKFNTEHDGPYWRGAIWININFLAVRALNHYAKVAGPYQDKARQIYTELRQNLINNMFKQYRSSGYIWEHYDDSTGAGKGTHPFTGWSSLVVLMMAEQF